jgi:hypothetical protein
MRPPRRQAHLPNHPTPPPPPPPPPLNQQAEYLRQLNASGQPEAVVRAFESGRLAASEEAVGEYVKALVRLDRLDNTRLLSTLQRGAVDAMGKPRPGVTAAGGAGAGGYLGGMMGGVSPAMAAAGGAPAAWYASGAGMGGGGGGGGGGFSPALTALTGAAAPGGGAGAAAAAATALGTQKNPVVITHAEPSLLSQFLRLIRTFGLAFIMVTAVGAWSRPAQRRGVAVVQEAPAVCGAGVAGHTSRRGGEAGALACRGAVRGGGSGSAPPCWLTHPLLPPLRRRLPGREDAQQGPHEQPRHEAAHGEQHQVCRRHG